MLDGRPQERKEIFDEWALVTQDCELAWKALLNQDSDFLVELRPLIRERPPDNWGIRSQCFRLDETGFYLDSNLPRQMVLPEVVAQSEHLTCPLNARRLKTWLGLRYDRPAIPQKYINLAGALAEKIKAKRTRKTAARVRDVLATFETGEDGLTRYELIAVLPSEAPEEAQQEVQDWISQISLEIPIELGVATLIEARSDIEVSLGFVERSYVLDVSMLSWSPSSPDLKGEFRP